MKITPLEIRQKSFEKVFRGYDKDEVSAFLNSLSQEWEYLQDEKKELKIRLETSQKEVEKLRQVETSLFKTLKTAEDTGANMIDQANKAAELHLKESQMKSEGILSESKSQARNIIEEAELKARMIIDEMETEVKSLQQSYRVLENYYDNLVNDLKNLANNSLDQVDKCKIYRKENSIESPLKKAQKISEESKEVNTDQIKRKLKNSSLPPKIKLEVEKNTSKGNDKSKSFFDQID